uniref:Uncharacterized protein n=1 Tax=Vitis vinifera TaxID=29760 RepID=F6H0S0_VITVI
MRESCLVDERLKVSIHLTSTTAAPHQSSYTSVMLDFYKISDIYPSLEKICLEGSRAQSKFAVSAIAALVGTSEQFVFSELCKALVDSLHGGQNIPTVLQSLGCMAQHSVSAFEARDKEITSYINETFFQVEPLDNLASFDETSECSSSCKLKVNINHLLKTKG